MHTPFLISAGVGGKSGGGCEEESLATEVTLRGDEAKSQPRSFPRRISPPSPLRWERQREKRGVCQSGPAVSWAAGAAAAAKI